MERQGLPPTDPGFGRVFANHMVVARYRPGTGWTDPDTVPFGDVAISPAAMGLHYGQAIFEGLKAYRQPDGGVALFRVEENAARFDRSARRLAMPCLPQGLFRRACVELVRADVDLVPSGPGQSLYLRPLMVATEPSLGVRPALEYLFVVMASPVGSYFPAGIRPLAVWVADEFVRAVPGGTGAAKCAGNYAASLAAKAEATLHRCDEVLWLDAVERRWVEELSGMNVVFVQRRAGATTIVTPPCQGTILDGVTRKSILTLAAGRGLAVVERPVSIDEIRDGAFVEAFACGTAAVIAPIGAVVAAGGRRTVIGDGEPGVVTTDLRDALVALQEGRADDPFAWRLPVELDLEVATLR